MQNASSGLRLVSVSCEILHCLAMEIQSSPPVTDAVRPQDMVPDDGMAKEATSSGANNASASKNFLFETGMAAVWWRDGKAEYVLVEA